MQKNYSFTRVLKCAIMKTVNCFFSTFCEKYIYCLVSKQEVRHTFRRAAMLDFQDVFYDVQGCMYLKKGNRTFESSPFYLIRI